MLRTRLLAASAAAALLSAPAALAQTAPDQTAPDAAGSPQTSESDGTREDMTRNPASQTNPGQSSTASPPAQSATTAQAATPAAAQTVVDVLRAQGQFSTLLSALDKAQLTDTLRTHQGISIFAPTDAAFAALPEAERTRLLAPENTQELRQLLLYHVIVADVQAGQIEGAKGGVQTAATTEVQIDGTGDTIKVDEATVVQADIDASNGAVYAIDRVLNPAQSQVASGDAEPVQQTQPSTTPPAEDDDGDAATDDADASPPADETDAMTDDGDAADADAMRPAAPSTTTTPTTTTTPAAPAAGELRAPNGQPATSVTTTASPPVRNPTDGQVDGENATPPVDTPEAGDEDADPSTTPPPPTPQ